MQFQRHTFGGVEWAASAFTRVCDALWAHGTDSPRGQKSRGAVPTQGLVRAILPTLRGDTCPEILLQNEAKFCQNEAKEEFSRNRMNDAVMEQDPVGHARIDGLFPIARPVAALTRPTRQGTPQNFLQNEANEEFPC